MPVAPFRVECSWMPVENANGRFTFTLFNLSGEAMRDFRFAYTSLTRTAEEHRCGNATLLRRHANFHQYAPPAGFELASGGAWTFTVEGLTRPAVHRTDGVKSAYVTLADGRHLPVAFGDLMLEMGESAPPPPLLPEGRVAQPFALLPWPAACRLEPGQDVPVALYPEVGTPGGSLQAVSEVLSLFHRLFPNDHVPFSLARVPAGRALALRERQDLAAQAYTLDIAPEKIVLGFGGPAGRFYGLVSLAQLLHGARRNPERFRFPAAGAVADAPRHAWRGAHLDVSRQFFPVEDVRRFIDILAWNKLNVFHWHLTDDEAWRIEIKAYPRLTEIGSRRSPDGPLLPQLGDGAAPRGGYYTQGEVRALVAHAAALHVEVVPEIDIPGHSEAMLVSLPELVDGQEAPESYFSVQGYPNNALNPAVPFTYEVLGRVFDELVALFPSRYIHVGGDEVAEGAWLASPLARALMERENIAGTSGLQSFFLRRIKAMLAERGRLLAGWNEVAHGGGVEPEGTLLMAWQSPEIGMALAEQGYDVVMTPGQAYYLDMVQADAWQEPGASWAGTVPPRRTYEYEAEGDFPARLKERMKGIQACIWTENFISRAYFNHLVFPRLCAVAEAAWTPRAAKDWQRFCALAPLAPRL
ncbi:beta-N-acetylhexosaminidase [Chelativorans intermedius]|uniref:beta-N-acetylhexosaminidase n=1 Tax=Chelativorans intermedius TaxID=515947 RepID=A0ABV6D6M1_9HYPH|nr:family 20 glycosylhydrolase [Chelativorans intermedius]MCT8998275.1 family 20 glycosylhydrolase [Chelativorans intermedius]